MNQGTYIMHYRAVYGVDIMPHGGATLAIRRLDEDRLVIAKALCSRDDVFNRKLGRTIAEGRLNSYFKDVRGTKHIQIVDLKNVDQTRPIKDIVDEAIGQEMTQVGLY